MKKIIIFILMTLFLLAGINAHSQKSSPTPLILSKEQQNESTPKQTKGNTNQQETYGLPPAVKIIPTQPPNAEKTGQAKQVDHKSPDEWTLFNLLLVSFNGLLAIFTFLLWRSTDKLWMASQDQCMAMYKQAIEMEKTVFFTHGMADEAAKSARATGAAAKAAHQSVELAREEFVASHPPKLRVHSISMLHPEKEHEPYKIQCFITNIGGSVAAIKKSNLTFKKLENPLHAKLPLSEEDPLIEKKVIKSGEYTTGTICLVDKQGWSIRLYENALAAGSQGRGANDLYFFGYIDYLDNIGTNRRIAFCRRYDITTGRFSAVQDEDHEYSY